MDSQVDVKCRGCGTHLEYKPGTDGLTCSHCNYFMEFSSADVANEAHKELNLEEYLQSYSKETQQVQRRVISCESCSAETDIAENQQSGACPFCETPFILAQSHSEYFIKPKGMLPFVVDKKMASANAKKWLEKRWFAPSALKQVTQFEKLKGVYLPFWTYDCATFTHYSGERGDRYTETISVSDGKGGTRTEEIQRTRWSSQTGSFHHDFDDVLIPASTSLPAPELHALAPWDLNSMVPYKDEYLSGYVTESYQIDLRAGYQQAKEVIDTELAHHIKHKIGGDEQKIESIDTRYTDATFKHILLPVWVSAYRYKNKPYRIIVNARTGAIHGERPWSWIKVVLLVMSIAIAISVIVFLTRKS